MWSNQVTLIVLDFSNYGKARKRIKTVPYLILAENRTLGVPRDLNLTNFQPNPFFSDFFTIGS